MSEEIRIGKPPAGVHADCGAMMERFRGDPAVEIRDHTVVQAMRLREVKDEAERARLWDLAVAAFPPYAEYQTRTARKTPVFVEEPER